MCYTFMLNLFLFIWFLIFFFILVGMKGGGGSLGVNMFRAILMNSFLQCFNLAEVRNLPCALFDCFLFHLQLLFMILKYCQTAVREEYRISRPVWIISIALIDFQSPGIHTNPMIISRAILRLIFL